jgi:DNA helicase-2/ATP-dependent DNA helicase PcrA
MPFELTSEQRKAINHLSGDLQIIACAGSGKTEVVSRRIAELIKNDAKPKSIVAFTFTEKAAEELKARIREILDAECPEKADLGDMYVGTIHSFCFEMLKELEPRYRGYDVLDDARRVAFISMPRRYYKSHLLTLLGNKFRVISKFLESYDIVRMEDIDINKLSNEDFAECCRRYAGFLDEERFLDFQAMIYNLVKLIETNKSARKALHERISHLVVDEYQDVDQLQEKLIKYISEGCKSLCVVGDDDQCIYNWRGSTVDNIINFSKKYPNVAQIPISNNFRSTERVIDCAKKFIRHNKRRLLKEMKPRDDPVNQSHEDDLFYRHFVTEEEEFTFIVDRINALLGTDMKDKKGMPFAISLGDFAILTRTRKEAAKIVPYLERANIDFVLDIGGEVLNRPEAVLGLNCLGYIFQIPIDDIDVTRKQLEREYVHVFIDRREGTKRKYPKADAAIFLREIEKVKTEASGVMAKGSLDYLSNGLQPYFHSILKAFGADRFEFEEVYNYNFAVLSQAIADYESVWRRLRASEVKYFFGFISAYGMSGYADTSHSDPSLVHAVKVLTIHRAKGLEFPVVFVPGFVREMAPRYEETYVDENLYDVERYVGDEEDERRVCFTAVTRSMKYLFLTGSSERNKSDGSRYARSFEPHPFIYELTKDTKFSNTIAIVRPKSGYPDRRLGSSLFPTSFSDINCYQRCGYDYLLRNVFGYRAGVPPAFGYGTRLHNILNIIYNNYITSRKIPSAGDIKDLFEKHFFLRYATDSIIDTLKVAGIRVINNYVEVNAEDFSTVLETEKKFELVHSDALITGQIDLLKKLDENGNVKEVEIIDFKTERDEEDDEELYRQDHEMQLRLYAIACLRSLGLSPQKACVHHLDRRSKEKAKDYVDITQPELDKVAHQLNVSISNIVLGCFNPNPSEDCGDCDWNKICPHNQKSG